MATENDAMKDKETESYVAGDYSKEYNGLPVRNQKDTVFCMYYRNKKELLKLYNGVNGTNYDNEDDLEVITLENAIYMNMKNDVSCMIDTRMNLYEHQSTVNPNMPLRNLFYVARLYEKLIQTRDIYSRRRIELPTPKFLVFYNGEQEQPEVRVMKLSESFITKTEEVSLELVTTQLNINPGYNEELKRACPSLQEYTTYVQMIRENQKSMPIDKAVEKAVNDCIQNHILEDFLRKNKSEAIQMSIFEYDEEKHRRTLIEEGKEEGREEGMLKGKAESIIEFLHVYGEVPYDLKMRILEENNIDVLSRWIKTAAAAKSVEEFQKHM